MPDEFRDTSWGRADGSRVLVKDMDLGHLVNVVNWVHVHNYSDRIREGFTQEVKRRQFELFATKKPYPCQVDGQWKIMDPKTGHADIIPPPQAYIEAVKDNETYQRMSEQAQEARSKKQQKQ